MPDHVIIEERDTSTINPQWHQTRELVAVYGPFPGYVAAEAMCRVFKAKGGERSLFSIAPLVTP